MKTKRTNRLLALLLSLVMVVGLLPMSVLAAGEDATAPARYEYVLASDGIDDGGVYAILTSRSPMDSTGSNRILYYNGTSDRTNQVTPSAISDNRLSLDTSYDTETQLWEASVVEGGIALRSLAGSGNKYLKVASDSAHAHVDVSEDPQALTITNGVSKSGCTGYSIVQGGYSLNWSGSIYTWNDPANVLPYRFFKQTPVWTVTFTGEEVTESTDEVLDGGNATLPAEPSREGYTFEGWFVGEDEFTAETAVTANVTATAKWEEIPVEPEIPDEPEPQEKTRYYFETPGNMPWKIGDGSGGANTVSDFDDKPDMANVTTIKAAGNYRAWAAGGFLNFVLVEGFDLVKGEILAQQATTGASSPYFHVKKQESDTYIISYEHTNGFTYYLTAKNREYNEQTCAVFSPNKADAVPYFIEATAEGAVTYRIWCKGPYTVNFDGEGAEDIASLEGVYYGTTLPTPADREGYTFLGWFDGETKYTEVTDDVTLTAKWKMDPGYTPEDAVAEGKTVTYLAFTGGDSSSRWWDAASTAGNTTKIQLYNAAGATATSATTLDTDGITAGNYVINFDTGNSGKQAVMHYSNGVTNQCSSVSVTCGTNGPLHLFVFEKAEDNTAINAFTIKAYNTTKYLSLEASGSQREFKDDKTTFYITPAADPNDGTYYIWTATGPATPEPVPDVPGVEPPAALEPVYEYQLDTDGLESGEYGITAPGNNRTVGMHDSGSYTNQCPVTITGEVMTLPHIEHNWTVVQKPNGKYTIQGSGGKYLTSADCTNPTNQLVLGTEAEEFTVTHVSGGSYTVQNAAGKYLTFTESGSKRWGMADSAFNIQFYKKTEVEPDMAQTVFKGTSDKPMDRLHILDQDDDVDTEYRIPALTTLDNGWIVAACDIRWSSTQDSPNNLDTIVSISKDGGESWEWEVVNYFSDFAPINDNSQRANSASFIDPALLVDSNGTLWMAVDLQPAHVNLGQNAQKTGSGFDENGLLMVGPISEAEWATKVDTALGRTEATRLEYQAQYAYRVDINGVNSDSVTATATKDGEEVTVYSIFHATEGWHTGYYVDAFFDLYYDYDEAGIQPVLVAQKESTSITQANLFYIQSPWKAYSTTYLMIRKATVKGDGLVWGDPRLVSRVKNFDGETFLAFCPGRGTSIQVAGENGKTVERVIFPVYDNVSSERASAVYTDDGGATWHRGERVENGETTSNSESQIVELHDVEGNSFLRMFSRNNGASGKYVSYADSFDNGLTWTTTKFDRDMPNGESTMMSFIGLEGFLVSPEGAVYEDLVLASYPRGTGSGRRSNGIVRIGYYDAEAEAMVWLNDKEAVRYPYKFTYSCLTQLRDEDGFTDGFALLYEDERNWAAHYGMEMGFDTFTSADLLGEGWSLVQTKPTEDKITVAPIAKQPYTGEPIEPAVTVKKNGVVLTEGYTVEYSNNTEVGEATVTVTVGETVVETTFQIVAVVVEPDEYTILSVIREQVYTGSPITPAVTVLKNGEVTEDYELEYLNNTEVGTATVNVLVNGEIVASVEFEIIGGVEEADVYTLGSIAARVYSGEAIEPVVAVYKNGTLMQNGYTVTYENNVNVGTATVIVLVDGVEVARGTFRITEAASTGTPSRPAVSVTPEQPEDPVEDLDDPDVPLAGLPMNFEDVTRDDWFYDEVKYVFDQELMGGVSSAEFAPNSNTTRAQIVTILYRLEDKPEVEAAVFADVESGDYYAESVAWGQMSGVVTGVGGGNFRPTRDVTREELMVILYRYAKYKALDVTAAGDLSVFQDGATTSDWAVEAMIWAVGAGLIRGKGEARLDPAGTATRAEVAAILMRFCEDFMK